MEILKEKKNKTFFQGDSEKDFGINVKYCIQSSLDLSLKDYTCIMISVSTSTEFVSTSFSGKKIYVFCLKRKCIWCDFSMEKGMAVTGEKEEEPRISWAIK